MGKDCPSEGGSTFKYIYILKMYIFEKIRIGNGRLVGNYLLILGKYLFHKKIHHQ